MTENGFDGRGIAFAPAPRRTMSVFRRGGLALPLLPAAAAGLLALAAAPAPPPRPVTASPPPVAAPAPKRPRAHFFVGEVVEIVAAENRFSVRETLRDGSPKVTFFTADAGTTIFRGKDPATFADLRVNDHVTIKYADAGGARKTLSIRITPSAKAKTASSKPPS